PSALLPLRIASRSCCASASSGRANLTPPVATRGRSMRWAIATSPRLTSFSSVWLWCPSSRYSRPGYSSIRRRTTRLPPPGHRDRGFDSGSDFRRAPDDLAQFVGERLLHRRFVVEEGAARLLERQHALGWYRQADFVLFSSAGSKRPLAWIAS